MPISILQRVEDNTSNPDYKPKRFSSEKRRGEYHRDQYSPEQNGYSPTNQSGSGGYHNSIQVDQLQLPEMKGNMVALSERSIKQTTGADLEVWHNNTEESVLFYKRNQRIY